jgi:archaellum biogenesis ATPase FlaH
MKFHTGIDVFDTSTGGINPGLIILAEQVGAGGKEFALTSLMNLSKKGDKKFYIISMLSNEDELKRDLKRTFPEASEKWIESLNIFSLSKEYFARTIVPASWVSEERLSLTSLKPERILEKLVDYFDEIEEKSVVFLDSLTDLARKTEALGGDEIKWKDFIDFLLGIKKLILRKNLLVYALLSREVVEKSRAEEIFYTADGVILFEWIEERDSIKRSMHIKKLTGALSILERQKLVKYDITIDPANGFTISRIHRIL